MKSTYAILCAGVGALVLTTTAVPVRAAEIRTTVDSRHQNIRTETKTDRTFGPVERANKLIGKTIYSSDNQKIGKLENLVVDLETGRILFAVVGTGTLGVGGHDYAVAPGIFTAPSPQGDLHLNVDKAKIVGAPQFSSNVDQPEQLGQANFINQVYQYFSQPAWWQGGNTAPDVGAFHNVHKAKDVIGMKVKNVSNEDLGKVENLIVNLPAGRLVYAILNPDSSLNLGHNYYALPPNALTWNADQKILISDLNKEKLAAAPHFMKDQYQTTFDPAFGTRVYQYYGKQAWFDMNSSLQPTGTEKGKVYPNK